MRFRRRREWAAARAHRRALSRLAKIVDDLGRATAELERERLR